MFADSIYDRLAVLLACFLLGLTLIVARRVPGAKGFVVLPRRWVVERTIGWLGRWRRLSKDNEQRRKVTKAMVTLQEGPVIAALLELRDPQVLQRGIEILARLTWRHGIRLRQSYQRVARRARREVATLIHSGRPRQAERQIR